jgi:hypothetical protein
MKKVTLNKSVLASAMLLAAGYMGSVEAHCLAGQSINATGTSAVQQDAFVLTCPTGTQSLVGRVSLGTTGTAGSSITYQIGKGGFAPAIAVDTGTTANLACVTSGASEALSGGATPSVTPSTMVVNGGVGQYTLLVSKNTATASTYGIEFHCFSGLNGSGTEFVGLTPATGLFEQGGPAVGTGGIDSLDVGTDTNTDLNLIINH